MRNKPQKTSNELTPKQTSLPATASMFAGDAGAGMEGAGVESFAIPFLSVLQKGSPQVDEASGAAIDGAKAGMLYENISGQLIDGKTGLTIVPCAYRRVFLHWSEANGFQGEMLPEEVAKLRSAGAIVEHKNRLYMPEKKGAEIDPEETDRIADARNHYVLIIDNKTGAWRQALISLGSTQIKKSRTLMTALASVKMEVDGKLITPATFANLVKVTTVPESNDKGTWFGWKFDLDGFVQSQDVYAAAKHFHKSVIEGQVKARYEEVAAPAEKGSKGF